jgi:RNA recognition motif-containing protein
MNIYVGNLSFTTTEEELRSLFESFGQVTSASILKDKFTDKSRGFGFVEMPEKEQAENAIQSLNGKEFNGRGLRVTEARPREENTGNRTRNFNDNGRNNNRW